MSILQIILIYVAAVSAVTFIVYGIDKWKSKHDRWRIPESVLIGLAVVGGSIGAWLGMRVWRHKTQHNKFRYGIPAILIAHILLVITIIYFLYIN